MGCVGPEFESRRSHHFAASNPQAANAGGAEIRNPSNGHHQRQRPPRRGVATDPQCRYRHTFCTSKLLTTNRRELVLWISVSAWVCLVTIQQAEFSNYRASRDWCALSSTEKGSECLRRIDIADDRPDVEADWRATPSGGRFHLVSDRDPTPVRQFLLELEGNDSDDLGPFEVKQPNPETWLVRIDRP
jgi:hypothetical protein